MRLGVFAANKVEDDGRPASKRLTARILHIHHLQHFANRDALRMERLIGRGLLRFFDEFGNPLRLLLLIAVVKRLAVLLY